MREALLIKTITLLERKWFSVEPFLHTNSCFDIVARKGDITLILKVFENIDALREEHAIELKKMVKLFNATAIVLGNKTKAFSLKDGVIYERYGLSAVTLGSLRGILGDEMPSIRSFKGKEIVELDSEKLREKRKQTGLTLGELANKIDSSMETVHRYEKGHSASLQAAEKLEKALGTKLVMRINLFEESPKGDEEIFDDEMPDSALRNVRRLGPKLALFKHAPFRAGAGQDSLMISEGKSRQEVKRKAIELHKTTIAFDGKGMVIAKKSTIRSIGHVPVIEEEELTTIDRFKDLMKMLREREREDP